MRCLDLHTGLHTGLHPPTSPSIPLHPSHTHTPPHTPYTPDIPAYRWVEYFDPQRNLPCSSMVKHPPWQCLRSALAPPQVAPDGFGRLGLHRGGSGHWAPQPLPRVLELAASKAADSIAFDHLRLEAPSRLGTAVRWAPEQSQGGMTPQCRPGAPPRRRPKSPIPTPLAFQILPQRAHQDDHLAEAEQIEAAAASAAAARQRLERPTQASAATVRSNGRLVALMPP